MADPPRDDEGYINPSGAGAYSPVEDAPPPSRSFPGWVLDTGIGALRGALSIPRAVAGAEAAISTAAPETFGQGQKLRNLTTLEDIDYVLKQGQTDTARYREEHPELGWRDHFWGKATETVAGMAPFAPLAATGAAAPGIFAGLAYGQAQSDLH